MIKFRTNPLLPTTYYLQPTTRGFTIIELIVVMVIIGVLATITFVSYGTIQSRAATETLKLDIRKASSQIASYKANTGGYPATGAEVDDGKGLSKSTDTTYQYFASGSYYCLSATSAKAGTATFYTSSSTNGSVVTGTCPSGIVIGTQTWAKANLNVGTMVTGVTTQTNNAILEKYCYSNTESNCTTYGGLYQWDEAMQYVTTQGAQGICPAGSHIPSDNDWKILEMQLGMTQAQADATGWRGTDQGTQLKPGGTSGLNMPHAGYRLINGSFGLLSVASDLWSSSESSTNAWYHGLYSPGYTTVERIAYTKGYGFSVRCLEN